MGRRLPRRRLLLVLLLATLVVPAVLLSGLALHLLRDFERLQRTSWDEYSEYLVGIAARDIELRLWNEEQKILAALRIDPPVDIESLSRVLPSLVESNQLFLTGCVITIDGHVVTSSDLPPPPELPGLADSVLAFWASEREGPVPIHHLSDTVGADPVQIGFVTHRNGDEIIGSVVLVWDLAYLSDTVIPERFRAAAPRVPTAFDRAFLGAHVSLGLFDATGRSVHTIASVEGGPMALRAFDGMLEFWSVGVELDDEAFESWMGRVRLTHWGLIAGMLATIAAGAALLARWFSREVEYAELKTGFVSNVSHELKTPLSLIRLYAETLELGRAETAEQRAGFLQIISKEAQRLSQLIDRVLDVARIESEHQRYHFEDADLGELVDETLDSYAPRFESDGIELERQLTSEPLRASVDREAIRRALMNLVDNGVKYSTGDPRLTVTLEGADSEAHLSVRDHGIGIPRADQGRIFGLFYRVEHGDEHSVQGLGLGLSMVRHIVEGHRGRITVVSDEGQGSTFTIALPLAEARHADHS